MTNYNIDIVFDTVCPWCYIGEKRLDVAIEQHKSSYPNDSFHLSFHAFQLNPQAPLHMDKQKYYEMRGVPERLNAVKDHLSTAGREVGIEFAFGGNTGNSRDSHRLVQLGKTK